MYYKPPFARYNLLSNRLSSLFDNRFDNRLYRVYSRLSSRLYNAVRSTGCQTHLTVSVWQPAVSCISCTTQFENQLKEQTVRSTQLSNWLYRVNGVLELKEKSCSLALWIWKKLFIGFREKWYDGQCVSWEWKKGWYRQSCLCRHVQKQLLEQFMVIVAVLR